MSGTTSAVTVAVDGFRPPFTAVQWQELEQQALIYKYMMAGLPVPPDLLGHIRRSLEALPARFFHHSALGYFSSYYGKKFDPEPGRCRRTDGKKWRCSKDAYPDSKYCERHMHRGRNRSRKPVESQSTAQSLSTATSQIITGSSTSGGSSRTRGNESFQNLPLNPLVNAETLSYGTSKFQMEHSPYGLNNKECRYLQGMTPDADEYNILSEASNSARGLGMDNNFDNIWRLMPSQVHSSPLLKPINDSHLQDNSTPSYLPRAYELDGATSKQRQQYCFFGNNIGSLGPVKQEQNSRRPFFEELPKTSESWSHLDDDDDGCKKNTFSTTQLSISMAPSDHLSRSVCSPDEAL